MLSCANESTTRDNVLSHFLTVPKKISGVSRTIDSFVMPLWRYELGTNLISLYSPGCSCCSSSSIWGNLFKKAQGSFVSNRIGTKFGRIVLQVNSHWLPPESDFWHDIIHDVISRRKVLPSGDCRRRVYPAVPDPWDHIRTCFMLYVSRARVVDDQLRSVNVSQKTS